MRVFAESVGGPDAPLITDDQCFITLRHANGSISTIACTSPAAPSHRPQRESRDLRRGRLAVIDDFREVAGAAGGERTKTSKGWGQDKGHNAEIAAFVKALTEGSPAPISWQDLRAVSLASILAVQSLREGQPPGSPTVSVAYTGNSGSILTRSRAIRCRRFLQRLSKIMSAPGAACPRHRRRGRKAPQFLSSQGPRGLRIVGVDLDPRVRTNPLPVDEGIVATTAGLPCTDASFDLAFSDLRPWSMSPIPPVSAFARSHAPFRPGGCSSA